MSDERRAEGERRAGVILEAMDLPALRDLFKVTQEDLAFRLSISQANVSRLERRDDMLVSTLRQWVVALGGELQILAVFPDGAVPLVQFAEPAP